MRRCIACRESKPQKELMRFVRDEDKIIYDETGLTEGRGYYLCRDEKCVNEALKRGSFNRACKCKMDSDCVERVANEALKGN